MANTKSYLEKIRLEGELRDLLFKAQQVEVIYNGEVKTLADALTDIYGSVSNVPSTSTMNAAIASAISASGHAHFEKVGAVPEVADAQENVLYLVMNANTGHYDIYAKLAGDTEGSYTMERLDDTTVDLSGKLDKVTGAVAGNLPTLTDEGGIVDSGKKVGGATLNAAPDANTLATEAAVRAAIDGQSTATGTAKGLMSAADKARLDGLRGVRCGTEVPADMQDGELFVRVVNVSQ